MLLSFSPVPQDDLKIDYVSNSGPFFHSLLNAGVTGALPMSAQSWTFSFVQYFCTQGLTHAIPVLFFKGLFWWGLTVEPKPPWVLDPPASAGTPSAGITDVCHYAGPVFNVLTIVYPSWRTRRFFSMSLRSLCSAWGSSTVPHCTPSQTPNSHALWVHVPCCHMDLTSRAISEPLVSPVSLSR